MTEISNNHQRGEAQIKQYLRKGCLIFNTKNPNT